MVRKLIVNDGSSERELVLVGTVVVGRDPSCELHDLDPLLSRRHAEFVTTAQGVTVRDLDSRNGILVNGDKVPQHALRAGDVVQLGHLNVRYIEEAVIKTAEEHHRSHANTATGMETPIMVPPVRPAAKDSAAAEAPTQDMPVAGIDDEETRAIWPFERAALPREPRTRPIPDDDATRIPGMSPLPVLDFDAYLDEETRLPAGRGAVATGQWPAPATEARIVTNASLIVTDASPGCHEVMGARPETIIGGRLTNAIERTLLFVSTGDGPSTVSLSISRAESGSSLVVTFKAG